MRSLTTSFQRPPVPAAVLSTEDLGLPPKHLMHLYLIPQTLYKLHPDFDYLIHNGKIKSAIQSRKSE